MNAGRLGLHPVHSSLPREDFGSQPPGSEVAPVAIGLVEQCEALRVGGGRQAASMTNSARR